MDGNYGSSLTFVHKTRKTNFQQLCFQVPHCGTLGEGLVLRPSPRHTPEPAGQQHRKCQPLSPEQLAPLPKPSWKHLSWGKAGTPDARPDRKSHTQTKAACSRASTQHSGWSGAGEAARGQAGALQPGKQLWVWETCLFPDFRASPLSQPTATNYWASQSVLEFFLVLILLNSPITQQRERTVIHIYTRDPRLTKTMIFPTITETGSARTGSRAQVFCITFLSAKHPT